MTVVKEGPTRHPSYAKHHLDRLSVSRDHTFDKDEASHDNPSSKTPAHILNALKNEKS